MTDQERLWQALVAVAPSIIPACFERQPLRPEAMNFNLGTLGSLSLMAAKKLVAVWDKELKEPTPLPVMPGAESNEN